MHGIADLATDIKQAHTGTAWRTENATRKLKRARRLLGDSEIRADADLATIDGALERVLGQSDLVAVSWLDAARGRASAVARVDVPNGSGTGFLVSRWLLMTNQHVIPDASVARATQCRFGFQEDLDGQMRDTKRVGCDPTRFFRTNAELDYTLVAVEPLDGQAPGHALGAIPLIGSVGKILVGEPVNIIQHPHGRPKEIAFRNNLLVSIDDEDTLTYQTDTDSGSSGSPVFNDQWEMVALHHSSVEAMNAAGRKIDRLGRPVTRATPEHMRAWTANEGIRASAIVRDLTSGAYRGEHRQLIDEVFELGGT